jgi:environmental stress-induced protein Ves
LLSHLTVRRWAQAVPVPWRNGGGVTRELDRLPAEGDVFDWRVSVAQVDVDGPFSSFPGHERVLVLLTGSGIDLHTPDGTVRLRDPFQAHRFPGEQPIIATLPDGATTDFNLMWRREVLDAEVAVIEISGAEMLGGDELVLCYVADGVLRVGGQELAEGDLARVHGAQRIEGVATLIVCSLRPTGA